jgi:hypothetical protein
MVRISQHYECDKRRVVGTILAHVLAFAGDIDLEVLDAKDLLKIFEEFDKVLGNFLLSVGCWRADCEPSSNGLFNPIERHGSAYDIM